MDGMCEVAESGLPKYATEVVPKCGLIRSKPSYPHILTGFTSWLKLVICMDSPVMLCIMEGVGERRTVSPSFPNIREQQGEGGDSHFFPVVFVLNCKRVMSCTLLLWRGFLSQRSFWKSVQSSDDI